MTTIPLPSSAHALALLIPLMLSVPLACCTSASYVPPYEASGSSTPSTRGPGITYPELYNPILGARPAGG